MSHVTEKIAEIIFEELPAQEIAAAKQHMAECAACREQVDRFQQTLAMLSATPDAEPPRNIVFEFEKPVNRIWRWFPATVALTALLFVTIALVGRVHIQWHDSQLTIAFGQTVSPAQTDTAAELATEIQRMKGHMAYLEGRQQAVERDTIAIAATIQPVVRAQRSPTGD